MPASVNQEPLLAGMDSNNKEAFQVYPARYHQACILCTLILVNSFVWVTFSSTVEQARQFYETTSLGIDAVALLFQVLFLPGTLLSYLLVETKGLRGTLMVGGILTSLSAIVRLISVFVVDWAPAAYIFLFIGTSFAALAQPLLLNMPPQLASNWFSVQQRDLVTSISFMFSPLGNALGVSLSPLFVSFSEEEEVHGMLSLMVFQCVLIVATTFWAWVSLREYPPTPPSLTTRKMETHQNEEGLDAFLSSSSSSWREVLKHIHVCLSDKDFLLLLWCFGIGLGFFNALLTVLGQLLSPCGYSEDEVGIMGGVFLGAGLFGAVGAGVVMDKTHQYRLLLKGGYIGAFVAVVLFSLVLQPNHFGLLTASFVVLGSMMLPILPTTIENGVECTWPVPEIYSSGLLLTLGNIVGIPIVFALSALIDYDKDENPSCRKFAKPAVLFILVVVTLCAFPILAFRGKYKRLEAEKRRRRMEQEQQQQQQRSQAVEEQER